MESIRSLTNSDDQNRHGYPTFSRSIWKLWLHRYTTRKQLHRLLLDDAMYVHQDLGLSTDRVLAEVRKPFWQA